MFVDLMFIGEPGDEELVSWAGDQKIVFNFLGREGFGFDYLAVCEAKYSPGEFPKHVIIKHGGFGFLDSIINDTISIFSC